MDKPTVNLKDLNLPVFFPDATRGVIRGLSSDDLVEAGVKGLVTNTYHLMTQPGGSVLKKAGGLKRFMNWEGVLITDSGGFQVLTLVHEGQLQGSISDDGVVFTRSLRKKKKRYSFTPEKSIEMQFAIGSDIMVCFDDCPSPYATGDEVRMSVDRTIAWARRSKKEYLRLLEQKKIQDSKRPLLFGVIQGGDDINERTRCAEALKEIGFNGYGFGGWPLKQDKTLNSFTLKSTAELMPNNLMKYALGVGNPQAIVDCAEMGYTIFDCTLPTRDARHKRLYILNADPHTTDLRLTRPVYDYVHIMEERYTRDNGPVSEFCDCETCQHYSKAYLQHLFKIDDALSARLATIHNLRTYMLLMENLREFAG
jgi:queuine tRNA-ribosyltransferase